VARALDVYRRKRDFRATPEPRGRKRKGARKALAYVVHKHAARRLHYDVRLELDGVLQSFAVPKGPPLEPGERRLAVHTEDHPLEYVSFEGVIPPGQYGAGTMEIWDSGVWEPEGDPRAGLREGKLVFRLAGKRLNGRWTLVKLSEARSRDGRDWLMIKRSDRAGAGRNGARDARADETALTPASLPGARRAAQPRSLAPELCRLAARAPSGEGWLHEIKFDGYRLIAILTRGRVRLLTRRGEDWSARFPRVAEALAQLGVPAVIDGEVVVLDERGASDFQRLQNSLRDGRADPLFFAFDLPWCGGYDLARCPLEERKRLLAQLLGELPAEGRVRFSEHVAGDGSAFLEHACTLGLEGAISKPAAAPYTAGKRLAWIKTKCLLRQEFVVAGWSEPTGSRRHLGALLLGYHEDGALRSAGKVGTGFTDTSLRELAQQLAPLARESSPFAKPPRGAAARGVHWVEPTCVVEVAFTGWTSDGRLRHPSFQGVREDKRAEDVVRERARVLPSVARKTAKTMTKKTAKKSAAGARVAGVAITHPERVLYPELGVTKLELAQYYAAVAERILPHVADRPLTLVRCPEGRARGCFYQKHRTDDLPESILGIRVPEQGKTAVYVGVRDVAGLVALVQRGVLELHPWGARADNLERPDRLVIDLDPGPDVPWTRVVAAARELRELAGELGLESFARTTGGKGLHVVLPIDRRSTWDEAKGFSHALGRALARRDPDAFVLVASKAKRKGRIFVDYLRNGRGATAVASWSARSFPGATVATPLAWDEVDKRLAPSEFDVRSTLRRLERLERDPWAGFFELRQSLTARVLRDVAKL
jgi:bifunctional non-homologous end joining protein LigD